MLSSKPVITAFDSGGPLEFVQHQQTGYVLEPDAQAVAAHIDGLYRDRQLARDLGARGLEVYREQAISWDRVVETLLVE